MKIKSSYTSLVTKNSKRLLDFFCNSGFKVIHENRDTLVKGNIEYVLENDEGQRLDIVQAENVDYEEAELVRINVEDFDEALEHFKKNNATVLEGPVVTDSYKACALKTKVNTIIMLYEHLGKEK